MMRSTISRGNSATTAAMDSASLKVGMTTATTRRLLRHGYRLQRNPQLAQASGGVFDLSALRKSV